MKSETNNLQVAGWTEDSTQQEKFFNAVHSRIEAESEYMAGFYGVRMYQEDIASGVRLGLSGQMRERAIGGPFAKDSPEEAAAVFLDKKNYQIREKWARPLARKIAKERLRQAEERPGQAEVLAKVGPPNLRQDVESKLFAVCESLPQISKLSNLTPRESEAFCMEMLRRLDIDDHPASVFDQFAQAAGIAGSEERAYIKDHDENRHSSASNRKALSRALAKVKIAFTAAKVLALLGIVLALSLVLCNATHQRRSSHQNHFVTQGSFIDQNAPEHQSNLIGDNAPEHQSA